MSQAHHLALGKLLHMVARCHAVKDQAAVLLFNGEGEKSAAQSAEHLTFEGVVQDRIAQKKLVPSHRNLMLQCRGERNRPILNIGRRKLSCVPIRREIRFNRY